MHPNNKSNTIQLKDGFVIPDGNFEATTELRYCYSNWASILIEIHSNCTNMKIPFSEEREENIEYSLYLFSEISPGICKLHTIQRSCQLLCCPFARWTIPV